MQQDQRDSRGLRHVSQEEERWALLLLLFPRLSPSFCSQGCQFGCISQGTEKPCNAAPSCSLVSCCTFKNQESVYWMGIDQISVMGTHTQLEAVVVFLSQLEKNDLKNEHPAIIALKITNSLRCLLRAADPESSVPLCCLPLSPSNKFRSQVGRQGVSDARSAAWRPQKMTASRCMNRRILVFGLCTTADGEINAGWTNYGRFVWFPQCHVYVSLGFLLQS